MRQRQIWSGANLAKELSKLTASVTVSRNLTLADAEMVLNCSSASAIVLTIPTDATALWSGVVRVTIYQAGAGASSFAAGGGVTLRGTPPAPTQYGSHYIMRVGVNEWAYR